MQIEKFAKRNVELLPDKMELLSDTELTQYFMQSWILEYNDPGKLKFYIFLFFYFLKFCIRFTFRWFENGDSIQASSNQ